METTFLEEFCHKQEQRNEVGVGEGDRIKRVLGDEMVCLTLRRMIQQRRENGGYQGDGGEVQEQTKGMESSAQTEGSLYWGMESPGMVRGEKAENMCSGAAKVVTLVVKALESSLQVACL